MDFYYQKAIEGLKPKCPPESYKAIERVSYRWVFDSMNDERNFKAQAEKNPKIVNGKSDIEICDCFALSFHVSIESSKEHFYYFAKKSPMAYKRLGTHISAGKIKQFQGVAGSIELNGHFNFHHVKDNNFAEEFIITEKL